MFLVPSLTKMSRGIPAVREGPADDFLFNPCSTGTDIHELTTTAFLAAILAANDMVNLLPLTLPHELDLVYD